MYLKKLALTNFRQFERKEFEFNCNVNLLIGDNGVGKTSVIECLRTVFSKIMPLLTITPRFNYGFDEADIRHGSRFLQADLEVRIAGVDYSFTSGRINPVNYSGIGMLERNHFNNEQPPRISLKDNPPLVLFFSTRRSIVSELKSKFPDGPKAAYYRCFAENRELRAKDLSHWIKAKMAVIKEAPDGPSAKQLLCLEEALRRFLPGFDNLRVESNRVLIDKRLISCENTERIVPLELFQLSDGERSLVAFVADIARRLAQLNPLCEDPLSEGKGIVLIDELDLHLHPKWQRRIVEDLRRTFPSIQFIATSHSPILIQTLRPGELIMLDGEPTTEYSGRGIEEVVRYIMGVDMPEISPRFAEMKDVAKRYFELLEKGKDADEKQKQELKSKLEVMTAPYSDNPAYVAFLEQKRTAAGIA